MSEELTSILKTAIEMEEKGQKFYKEEAELCQNPLGKKTFEALAQDEIDHINAIKTFHEKLCNTAECTSSNEIMNKIPPRRAIQEIFQQSITKLQDKVEVTTDDKEAYKLAMDLENDGFNFYKRHWRETQNTNAKKLLEFLMNEEKNHYNLLQSTYLYLSEPAEWFTLQESPMFEG